MRKLNTYMEFINEEFFKKIFNKKKKTSNKSNIETCVNDILNFMEDNNIKNWNDFMSISNVDRDIIDKIIDNGVKSLREVKEIRFLIKLELSNHQQLKEYLKELEEMEEYEKCAKIVKKLTSMK